jgi:hypothetical protein
MGMRRIGQAARAACLVALMVGSGLASRTARAQDETRTPDRPPRVETTAAPVDDGSGGDASVTVDGPDLSSTTGFVVDDSAVTDADLAASTDVAGSAVPLSPAASLPADGAATDGMVTGGSAGATILIADTIGGADGPAGDGGDASVDVAVGTVSAGQATSGTGIGGSGLDLLDPDIDLLLASGVAGGNGDEPLLDADGLDEARLTGLLLFGEPAGDSVGPIAGGAATGGSAVAGDAALFISIGDTVAGIGGGDASVVVTVDSVIGGNAVGGDATGGGAFGMGGAALGGAATGGAAIGGDATLSIAIGETRAPGGGDADASVAVAVGRLVGGDAVGGDASGGTAWGWPGFVAGGGDASGGQALGGEATLAIVVGDATGGRYTGSVGQVVGGTAHGGTATGGDSGLDPASVVVSIEVE